MWSRLYGAKWDWNALKSDLALLRRDHIHFDRDLLQRYIILL